MIKSKILTSAVFAGSLAISSCATAQSGDPSTASAATTGTTAPQTPPPPCRYEIYRAFDFWLGEWEVFDLDDKKVGENKISARENGCLMLEEWTSASGGTGQSYNFYDPGMKKWRQIWVSGFGTIDYAGGLNDDGAMALEGEIAMRNATTAPFRGIWTLQDDGSVRQHFDQYNSETEKWDVWFVGIYRAKETE